MKCNHRQSPHYQCSDGQKCHLPWGSRNVTCYKVDKTAKEATEEKPHTRTDKEAEPREEEFAKLLHYPECWDTAAYPTLDDAIHEALAWSGCSVCESGGKTSLDEAKEYLHNVCSVDGNISNHFLNKIKTFLTKGV